MSPRTDSSRIEIGEHRLARFNHRMPIGPARWSFHDLFWVHEGGVRLQIGDRPPLRLDAPSGVLILPDTPFSGTVIDGFAAASICHFRWSGIEAAMVGPGYLLPRRDEAMSVLAMLRLSLQLASGPAAGDPERRRRLLRAILDCFVEPTAAEADRTSDERLELAWRLAETSLGRVRSLSDVAAIIGVKESAFRARHRLHHPRSAGSHLREMRLKRAENLLATTRHSVTEIAGMVGYGHPETFIAAFRLSRGCTPGQFRHRSNPLA